jgi:membrane protease YdiL (CAAX protease family)
MVTQEPQDQIVDNANADDPGYDDFTEKVTYTQEEIDKKWYGVLPKGEKPIHDRFFYVFLIIVIILIEIGLWAIYRWSTAAWFESFGTHQFYLVHIIAAPTIHLVPILLFWWFVIRERGHPFVFTKKLLLTGILIGFIAAIIWRLLEQSSYEAFAGMAGGTVSNSLTFWNLLESADLFILMTFVMYFVVGPVEELEFRGFAQDQTARATPNWVALIISSVLFGCSHIPIAIFVYELHLVPTMFVDALFSWIVAGFTFGVLYMLSRNIFACIVMHGMGNWQLSVYYFASESAGMSPGTAMGVGIATTIVANGLMILIFYFIHKFYWEPHRRGEPAFNGIFMSLQKYLHEHDFEEKPVFNTVIVFGLFIVVVSAIIMGAAVAFGTSISAPLEEAGGTGSTFDIDSLTETEENIADSGNLAEGQSEVILLTSEAGRYVKSVTITVTWTDEPDIQRVRTYENQPDTFSVEITGLNKTAEETAANTHGSEGTVSTELEFTDEELVQVLSDGDMAVYEVSVEITMVEAGMFAPGVGIIGYTDNGNSYEYEMVVTWLVADEE